MFGPHHLDPCHLAFDGELSPRRGLSGFCGSGLFRTNAEESCHSVKRLAAQDIHPRAADELRHKKVGRRAVEFGRRADLGDVAFIHHDDTVSERHGLRLVMGHMNEGGSQLAVEGFQFTAHMQPELGVEIRQRLVEKKRLRLADDGAPHRDPLPLASRKLCRTPIQELLQPQPPRRLDNPLPDVVPVQVPVAKTIGHVVEDRHVGVERIGLEHHGKVTFARFKTGHSLPVNGKLAAGDRLKPGNHPEKARLAASGRPDYDKEFAVTNIERHTSQRQHAVGIGLRHVEKRYSGHVYFSLSINPLTNRRCIESTINTGGSRARTAVPMMRCQSGSDSPVFAILWMPITMV